MLVATIIHVFLASVYYITYSILLCGLGRANDQLCRADTARRQSLQPTCYTIQPSLHHLNMIRLQTPVVSQTVPPHNKHAYLDRTVRQPRRQRDRKPRTERTVRREMKRPVDLKYPFSTPIILTHERLQHDRERAPRREKLVRRLLCLPY